MDREDFYFLSNALMKDLENLDMFECSNAIIKYVEKKMNDTEKMYLKFVTREVKGDITLEDGSIYKLNTLGNLYDYFTIVKNPEDDIAYQITENLIINKNLNLPEKFIDAYLYICNHANELIDNQFIEDTDANAKIHLKLLLEHL